MTTLKSNETHPYDIYAVFVEKGLSLLNDRGRLGFILPHKFFNAKYGEPLRELLARGKHLSKVVHFGDQQVFENATTYTCLMFLDKKGSESFEMEKVSNLDAWRETRLTGFVENQKYSITGTIPTEQVGLTEWNFTVGEGVGLVDKLNEIPMRLGDFSHIFVGLQTSADTVYLFKEYRNVTPETTEVFSKELDEWIMIETSILKRVIRSGNVGRYFAKPTAFILFPYIVYDETATLLTQNELQKGYPLAWRYLNRNKKLLENREKRAFNDNHWYRFGRTQNIGMWEKQKILIPYMITQLGAYFDLNDQYYFINVTTGGFGITVGGGSYSYQYICGLINSKLLDFSLKSISTTFHGGYFAANKQFIEQLPIRPIDFTNPADVQRHDSMVSFVERMLTLHQQLAAANTPTERTVLQRQIETTDRQIDALVYELYGLTEEEIKIVEGDR